MFVFLLTLRKSRALSMKCKNWSNKINNFVVRRLKSIKINGQQQQQQQSSSSSSSATVAASAAQQQPQQQQQLLTTCSTMPAMPKEKAIAVSLSESNFNELKLKDFATSAAVVAVTAAAAMATTTATAATTQQRLQQQQQTPAEQSRNNRSRQTTATPPTNGHAAAPTSGAAPNPAPTTPQRLAGRNGHVSNGQETAAASPTPSTAAATPPRKTATDFIFGRFIGEGSYSSVYLAADISTKREYAIKVCDKRHILRGHKQEYIRREREVLHTMTNVPGFVNLSCTFQDQRSLYFVMTHAKNGDLLPYINKVGSFDVDCTRHYAAELVLACEQMHRRNIVHRDLKPENILLDENMHTLIADFGSAKILTAEEMEARALAAAAGPTARQSRTQSRSNTDDDEDEDDEDTGSDDGTSPNRSFVGTAQYVSPEVLQNGTITPSADLWALGCIIYQMISGLPPFRGNNSYAIFRKILACHIDFPQGFDKDGEDLVKQLIKVNPNERLGANDLIGRYESIRAHPFFRGVDFDSVREVIPPAIHPYLPGMSRDDEFRPQYLAHEDLERLEPGLNDRQITRLIGYELGTAVHMDEVDTATEERPARQNIYDLTPAEKQERLEQQQTDIWHPFADNEVILKKGFVNKRKGLFSRKRMLLLTTGPRLIYIDPVQMIKKGEIPWSPELSVEPKNFKIFFVCTPNRTYYLEDPEGYSLAWNDAIKTMHALTYPDAKSSQENGGSTSTRTKTSSTSSTSSSMSASSYAATIQTSSN